MELFEQQLESNFLLYIFHQDIALQMLLKQLHSLLFSPTLRSAVHFLPDFLLSINRPLIISHFSCLLPVVPVADLVVAGEYLLPLSLVVASFLTVFFASARTSYQLLSQPLISFSWNNALQDQPVEEEVEDPTELLVQLGNEWS